MKAKTKSKALKRLIPAVAMLAMSATMLSTATYAWFTMNKEVKMTGLNMTATVGEGIEISLASVTTNSNSLNFSGETYYDGNHPKDINDEKGWTSSVLVGQYYKKIGKLKPASSADGKIFFDATNASDKGRKASTFKSITLGEDAMANLTTQSPTLAADTTVVEADVATNSDGYYVDIPVHIRTTKKVAGEETSAPIYCKLKINNSTQGNADAKLYNAIRVAFVPFQGDTSNSETYIFGFDDEYYDSKVVGSDGTLINSVGVVKKDFVTDGSAFNDGTGTDSGLNMLYATGDAQYGHLDFYVRVWLEGQSTSCFDDNAGQSWNIDLAFSLGEFETTTPNP